MSDEKKSKAARSARPAATVTENEKPEMKESNSPTPINATETVAKLPGNGTPPPLDRAPLSYENPGFLKSANGRLIRIVAEFMEPLARFRRERIQDTVV